MIKSDLNQHAIGRLSHSSDRANVTTASKACTSCLAKCACAFSLQCCIPNSYAPILRRVGGIIIPSTPCIGWTRIESDKLFCWPQNIALGRTSLYFGRGFMHAVGGVICTGTGSALDQTCMSAGQVLSAGVSGPGWWYDKGHPLRKLCGGGCCGVRPR